MRIQLYQWIFRWAVNRWRKAAKNPEIFVKKKAVTDHALLRYLERIDGIDMAAKRQEILNPELLSLIDEYAGYGRFIVDNVRYTVKDGSIVSVARPNSELTPHVTGLTNGKDQPRKWSF